MRGPLKEHHWRTLLTARAIENTVYLAAADHAPPIGAGNSMIVDPMGVELVTIGEATDTAVAWISREPRRRGAPGESGPRPPALHGGAEVTSATRVALVDDHAIVEVALHAALADIVSVEFVGVSPTVHELLEEHGDAEVVVLDLRLGDGSSPIANVSALRDRGMRVIAYTSGEDPYLVRLVARTDVLGIVRKSAPVGVLLETIRSAVEGEALMSTEWAAAIDADPELSRAELSAGGGVGPRPVRDGPADDRGRGGTRHGGGDGQRSRAAASGPSTRVPDVRLPPRSICTKRAIEDGFLPMPGRE